MPLGALLCPHVSRSMLIAQAGQGSLQEALHTGEAGPLGGGKCLAQVLCDLINAIWPGKIVGIARGGSTL